MLWIVALVPASDDLPYVAAASASVSAASDYPDVGILMYGLVSAGVVKLIQVIISSAIEGLNNSVDKKASLEDKKT